MRPQRDPATIKPRPGIVVVRPYERPHQTAGGILLPQTAYREQTASIYEVSVCRTDDDAAGFELRTDDIVRTDRLQSAVDLGCDDLEGRPLLALRVADIKSTQRWRTDDDGDEA